MTDRIRFGSFYDYGFLNRVPEFESRQGHSFIDRHS